MICQCIQLLYLYLRDKKIIFNKHLQNPHCGTALTPKGSDIKLASQRCKGHQKNAASRMKEVPIYWWNCKCYCYAILVLVSYSIKLVEMPVFCGYMSLLRLRLKSLKVSQLLANVLTQILSLVGLWRTKCAIIKLLKTLLTSAVIGGEISIGRHRNGVRRRGSQHLSRRPYRLQFMCAVIFKYKWKRSLFKTNTFLRLYGKNANRSPLMNLSLEVPWSQQNQVQLWLSVLWSSELLTKGGKIELCHMCFFIIFHSMGK